MSVKLISICIILFGVCVCNSHGSDMQMMMQLFDDMTNTYHQYIERYEGHQYQPQQPYWDWVSPSQFSKMKDNKASQYDFIIVGSGSAGSVIANRLSENPEWNILLLEVGKGENMLTRIPLIAPVFQFTDYDWHYFMEYQPQMCLGLENQRMYWPRGKALGGTSVINYMIYTRGNPLDYDRWAQAGNPGWSYEEVLPYYMKSERARLKYGDYRFHNRDGYLAVEDIYQSPVVEAFIRAGNELGLPQIDYNAPGQPFGVSTIQATVLNGERHTVARAFLHPIKHRTNLKIMTSAFVTKVLIDPETRQAFGVEYERQGKKYVVEATKEVILSAGAFNSPQLLMLSGIGPRNHLQELGIPVLQDLPVGQNLHDHLTFPGMAFLINKPVSIILPLIADPKNVNEYFTNGTGPYTSLGGVEGIGYIKTEVSQDPDPYPDIELLFVGATLATDYGLFTRKGMRITDEIYKKLLAPIQDIHAWTIFPMLLHPKSTGYLKLRSRNPYDYPLFYGNYFTDPENHDINTMVAAIRVVQRLSNTRPFRELGSTMNPHRIPGCQLYAFDSDQYWRCALRSIAVTLHHQVGTAKMGPPTDPGAVVNHELKVYGIAGLRVADTSVIPFALSAHTNAPSIMVGEKAADMIKASWGYR